MILFAVLMLLQPAPSIYENDVASNRAVEIFRQACTEGALDLRVHAGRILTDHEAMRYRHVLPGMRATTREQVIQFSYPRATFLVFADFERVQPNGIARECVLVSRVISLKDALRAIIWTAPDVEPVRARIPGIYSYGWLVDVPKRGFRASVSLQSDRSIMVELGTYASAADSFPTTSRNQ